MRTIIINNPGPQGAVGPQGNVGPTGSSQPFSNVSGSIWATTSSLQVTGSFIVSGSSTFTNIGPAVFSGSVNATSGVTMSSAVVSGDVTVLGTASINVLQINTTINSTGSNILGDSANDTQTLYGSVIIPTGSLTVSGNVSFGTSSAGFYWNNTNNRLGIGTASPAAKLDINGQIIIGNSNKTNGSWPLYISDSSNLAWKVADSAGNAKFEFYAGFSSINQMRLLNNVSLIGFGQNLVLGTGIIPTALSIVNSTGNVLIGTTTDAGFKLDVNGTARVSDVLYASNFYATNTATSGYLADFGGLTNGMVFQNAGVTNRTQLKGFSGSTETFRVDVANGAMFGAGSLDASAQVTINSTTKGVLIPRMTTTERNAIVSPTTGLQIFNTTDGYHEFYDAFWGWMPIANQNEWKQKYGFEIFNDGCQSDGFFGAGAFGTGQGNAGANILGFTYGNITFITGTTTSSGYRLMSNSFLALGGGNTRFTAGCTFAQLSTLADRYYINVGFHDVFGLNQTDAVCFVYDEGGLNSGSTASANWQCLTASNNVRTWTTTSVPVNAFRNLRIDINAAGTQALFYINEVLVATHTTNIPTGTARNTQCGASMVKATGTTSLQTIILDYIGLKMKLTTPRT